MTTTLVRVARGTQTSLPVLDDVAPNVSASADAVAGVIAGGPSAPLRMTIKPPRFTTTTPGVMRRQPR
jgi:N-acetylmuramic acid 6-phosphate (MurNAc-6-P) etherase